MHPGWVCQSISEASQQGNTQSRKNIKIVESIKGNQSLPKALTVSMLLPSYIHAEQMALICNYFGYNTEQMAHPKSAVRKHKQDP